MLNVKPSTQVAAETLIKELRDDIFEAIENGGNGIDLEELRQMIKLIDCLENVKAE